MIAGAALIGFLASVQAPSLSDLPLVEARAARPGRTLAIVMSGDGNWAGSVRAITRTLNAAGIPVVGIKSREYLTSATRTPESVTRDVERILHAYLAEWQADSVLLVGYSRGADILPFVLNRLSPALRAQVGLLAIISPSLNASFEFHFSDLFSNQRRPTDIDLGPEVARISGVRVLCMSGADDEEALCPKLDPRRVTVRVKPGGHHLDRDFTAVGTEILETWHRQ